VAVAVAVVAVVAAAGVPVMETMRVAVTADDAVEGADIEVNATICPHCGKMAVHAPADCFSLEANKDKKPAHWK